MANPQLENGFFRIANEIAEALMHTTLSAYQSRILWTVFRKTYGFDKKEDWISNGQMVEMAGLHKAHVSRSIRELRDRNIVTKRGGHKRKQYTKDILRDSPNPAIKHFLEYWKQAFKEKTGKDYFFNCGKEGSLTKRMLKAYPLDRLKELAGVFFKSQDRFFQDSAYTIGFFYSQINKVVVEAEKVKTSW